MKHARVHHMLVFVPTVLSLVLASAAASATTYYVSTSGNNTNSGTP